MGAIQQVLAAKGVTVAPSIALTQNSGTLTASASVNLQYVWPVAPGIGSRVVGVISVYQPGSAGGVTVSDQSGGSTNVFTVRSNQANGTSRIVVFDCLVTSAMTFCSVALLSGTGYFAGVFTEWANVPNFDQQVSATGTSTGGAQSFAVGPTGVLAQANELIVTGMGSDTGLTNSLISAPSGYTLLGAQQDSSAVIGMGAAYKIVSATTAVSATWPVSANSGKPINAAIAAFKGN